MFWSKSIFMSCIELFLSQGSTLMAANFHLIAHGIHVSLMPERVFLNGDYSGQLYDNPLKRCIFFKVVLFIALLFLVCL